MKKLLLFSVAIAGTLCSFAQNAIVPTAPTSAEFAIKPTDINIGNKTTALGDTLPIGTTAQLNGPYKFYLFDRATPADSGYAYGTNIVNFKGYAQLYDLQFDGAAPVDSSVTVIGVLASFGGKIQTTSTKNLDFNVWKRSTSKTAIPNRTKWFMVGAPQATTVASRTVPAKNISTTAPVAIYFTTPLTGINEDVYVGYNLSYSWSSLANDTFGLRSVDAGATNFYTVDATTKDTLLSCNNIYQENGGAWKSTRFDLGIGGDMMILPLIRLNCPTCWPTAVGGFSTGDITFFGNYPNPAVNNTNIKFSLKNNANVTVEVLDATGRKISSVKQNGTAGINVINIETSSLAAGNYIYTVVSSAGGRIASQFSVAK